MEMLGLDNKKLKEKGITLLEALVATAIVGVGFIAVFQMVNFSLRSIDVSSERTKIGYLSDMVAEDLLAYKNSTKSDVKFKDALLAARNSSTASSWNLSGCNDGAGIDDTATNAEDKSFDLNYDTEEVSDDVNAPTDNEIQDSLLDIEVDANKEDDLIDNTIDDDSSDPDGELELPSFLKRQAN